MEAGLVDAVPPANNMECPPGDCRVSNRPDVSGPPIGPPSISILLSTSMVSSTLRLPLLLLCLPLLLSLSSRYLYYLFCA